MPHHEDTAGPTPERLVHAGAGTPQKLYDVGGKGKGRRYTMRDDALARALVRNKITGEEYSALRRYALHWLAGGLASHMGSVDLNRILAHDPAAMSGLAKTERQVEHRMAYYAARDVLVYPPHKRRRAVVADSVACFDFGLREVGHILGYQSPSQGREAAGRLLAEAAERLIDHWKRAD
jgi:hypothetical protein